MDDKSIGMNINIDGQKLADDVVRARMQAVVETAKALHALADAIGAPVIMTNVTGCTISAGGCGISVGNTPKKGQP